MGLLDTMRTAIAFPRAAAARAPKWGRIVAIEPKLWRFARITLEIHYGYEPVFEHQTLTRIPRRVHAEVGQAVAIRRWVGEETGSFGYEIEWHRAPQYGRPREEFAEGEDPVSRFMDAQRARREGRIDEEELERARQAFVDWGRGRMPSRAPSDTDAAQH